MIPKVKPASPPRIDRIFEVVVENDASLFRGKCQKLIERQFRPVGGLALLVTGSGVVWIGQSFIRDEKYKDL